MSQVFKDEGLAEIEVEPRVESEVTSERPRESVGSGETSRDDDRAQEEEPERDVKEEVEI